MLNTPGDKGVGNNSLVQPRWHRRYLAALVGHALRGIVHAMQKSESALMCHVQRGDSVAL
jgi:hypothetical protein